MSEASLDKSLDTIIAEKKKGNSTRGRGGAGGRGGARGGGFQRNQGSGRGKLGAGVRRTGGAGAVTRSNNNNNRNNNNNNNSNFWNGGSSGDAMQEDKPVISRVGGGGRINRKRGGGGQNNGPVRNIVTNRAPRANNAGFVTQNSVQWSHDLFEREEKKQQGGGRGGNRGGRVNRGGRGGGGMNVVVAGGNTNTGGGRGFRVSITNLHPNVTEQDLQSYFAQHGNLKKVIVHYDDTNRSVGAADLVFPSRDEANKVATKFNNAKINGRQIQTRLLD